MVILYTVLKIALMIAFTLNMGAILTWADRRQSAMIQDRIGPNRAVIKIGKFELRLAGLLHPLADGIKFVFKEDFRPPRADKLLFGIAPILAVASVLIVLAAIPFGDTLCLEGLTKAGIPVAECARNADKGVFPLAMTVAPMGIGLLFVFAIAGQGIIAAAMAGASSDNKFSLMSALRAGSQMVSYEVTLGMSLIGAIMIYGTVRFDEMVQWQSDNAWGIFVQPFAFVLFFAAAVAETKRVPFDLPEAESELVSGYFTEYSGMKFAMFYLGEYMEVVTSSMLIVTIFLGGWALPFLHRDGIHLTLGDVDLIKQLGVMLQASLPDNETVRAMATTGVAPLMHWGVVLIGVLGFFGKVLVTCFMQTFVRWSLPRFRYDQLMRLCWKVLLPASLANIMVTGVGYLALKSIGPTAEPTLNLLADLTRWLVALIVPFIVIRGVIGFVRNKRREVWKVGSSSAFADRTGGTTTEPMQA
jgi:NADH-quinone oxidoreductase subunit H